MFNSPLGTSAADRISRFLDDYPDGELFVAVGYASVAGVAWLGARTVGRPVKLIIGNAQASRFQKATAADRAAAVEFLRRGDVEVKNWYRTGRGRGMARDAHLKVWAVLGPDGGVTAALVGSANLTRQGLVNNEEACVEASGADLVDIERRMTALGDEAWDCRERIVGYLEPDAPPIAPNAPRPRLGPSRPGVGSARRSSAPLQQPVARGPNSGASPPSASQQTVAGSIDGSGISHAPRRPAAGARPVHIPAPLPPRRSRRLLTGLGVVLTWLGRAVEFLLEVMVEGLLELFSEPPQRGGSRAGTGAASTEVGSAAEAGTGAASTAVGSAAVASTAVASTAAAGHGAVSTVEGTTAAPAGDTTIGRPIPTTAWAGTGLGKCLGPPDE